MPNKLYFLLWTAIVVILIGIMSMLYVSLLPHFQQIGNVAAILLYAWMVFGTVAGMVYIGLRIYRAYIYRNVVTVGEVVSYKNGNTWDHLSAEHEKAKVPRILPAPKDEPAFEPDEQDIINIYNNGQVTLQQLADNFDLTYNKVQRVVADAKKHGLITRK